MFEGGEQGSGLDEIMSFIESSGDLIEVSKIKCCITMSNIICSFAGWCDSER